MASVASFLCTTLTIGPSCALDPKPYHLVTCILSLGDSHLDDPRKSQIFLTLQPVYPTEHPQSWDPSDS